MESKSLIDTKRLMLKMKSVNGNTVALETRLDIIEQKVDLLLEIEEDKMNRFDLWILKTSDIARLTNRSTSVVTRWFSNGLHNINRGGKEKETSMSALLNFLRGSKPNVNLDLEALAELGQK